MGKILKTSLDFCFRRNRRFYDLRQIYANSRGFRLLHVKISKKFRKGLTEATFYTIEIEGCTLLAELFLTVHMLCIEKRLCTNPVKFLLSMLSALLSNSFKPRPNWC